MWRLVSHLSLNHLSVTTGPDAASALRELLRSYDLASDPADSPFNYDAIVNLHSRRVVRRLRADKDLRDASGSRSSQAGFCRGLEVTVELNEEEFAGTGEFLFGCVLERFLGLYCSVNSFVELVLMVTTSDNQTKELKHWPPRTGDKILH